MLCLSPDYLSLVRAGGLDALANQIAPERVPPLPLQPFKYALVGRLATLQMIPDWISLLKSIRQTNVRTHTRKYQHLQRPNTNSNSPAAAAAGSPNDQQRVGENHPLIADLARLNDFDAIALAAESPAWLTEMIDSQPSELAPGANEQFQHCRYLNLEDPLHDNSISRFHFLIKRLEMKPGEEQESVVHPPTSSSQSHSMVTDTSDVASSSQETATVSRDSYSSSSAAAAAAQRRPPLRNAPPIDSDDSMMEEESKSAEPMTSNENPVSLLPPPSLTSASNNNNVPTPRYRYFIKDLGSLNGVYINDERVKTRDWMPLQPGSRLRFAPITRNAKAHLNAIRAAAAISQPQPSPPSTGPDFAAFNASLRQQQAPSSSAAANSSAASGPSVDGAPNPNLRPLIVKDLHLELMFHDVMDEIADQRRSQLSRPIPRRSTYIPPIAPRPQSQPVLPSRPLMPPQLLPANILGRPPAQLPSPFAATATPVLPTSSRAVATTPPTTTSTTSAAAPPPTTRKRSAAAAGVSTERVEDNKQARSAAAASPSSANATTTTSTATAAAAAASDSSMVDVDSTNATAGVTPARSSRAGRKTGYHMFLAHHQRTNSNTAAAASSSNHHVPEEQKASHIWKNMTTAEKAVYQQQAEAFNRALVTPATNSASSSTTTAAAAAAATTTSTSASTTASASVSSPVRRPMDITAYMSPSRLPRSARAADPRRETIRDPTREVITLDDEDEPIIHATSTNTTARSLFAATTTTTAAAVTTSTTTSSATAAAASSTVATSAAASSSATASVPTASTPSTIAASSSSHDTAMDSMVAEFTCGICTEIIHNCVVLNCTHSFCRHCVETWFRRQRVCPICRAKHSGPPRAVRSVDNVIAFMIASKFTQKEKDERTARIAGIEAEEKARRERRTQRAQVRAQEQARRRQQQRDQFAGLGRPRGQPPGLQQMHDALMQQFGQHLGVPPDLLRHHMPPPAPRPLIPPNRDQPIVIDDEKDDSADDSDYSDDDDGSDDSDEDMDESDYDDEFLAAEGEVAAAQRPPVRSNHPPIPSIEDVLRQTGDLLQQQSAMAGYFQQQVHNSHRQPYHPPPLPPPFPYMPPSAASAAAAAHHYHHHHHHHHQPPPPPLPAPTQAFHVDIAPDRTTACRICFSIIEKDLLRLRQTTTPPRGSDQPTMIQHFHLACFVGDQHQPSLRRQQLTGHEALPQHMTAVFASLVPR